MGLRADQRGDSWFGPSLGFKGGGERPPLEALTREKFKLNNNFFMSIAFVNLSLCRLLHKVLAHPQIQDFE